MGALFAALLKTFPLSQIERAMGYEIDLDIGKCAQERWEETLLELLIEDFTKANPPQRMNQRANLLICNPPYVRHHHISVEEKTRLKSATDRLTSSKLNGMSGLYCYFLLLAHHWMAEDAIAGWLIPSEFMYVNYGEPIREYLTHKVTLLHVHRFRPEESQFDDALVSSAVVWFRNAVPPPNHQVAFSLGGSLLRPEESNTISLTALRQASKWNQYLGIGEELSTSITPQPGHKKLSDLFVIKRGLATGANEFFILTPEQVAEHKLPTEFLKPVLPSSRYLPVNEIQADGDGNPILTEKRFLLDCHLPMEKLEAEYPSLYRYLQLGTVEGFNERTLCRSRSPWYSQEKRPSAPLLCTYMGRHISQSQPFRFILNHSNATATNTYLMMYPNPQLEQILTNEPSLLEAVWQALNEISIDRLKAEGRVYGGGLYKLEPGELSNIPADSILSIVLKGTSP